MIGFKRGRSAASLVLALPMLVLASAASQADPCTDPSGNAVPGCQQVSATVDLKTWETKGWALYCPPNAIYYWGGYSDDWSHSPHIFWEDKGDESISKADFTMSNTRLGHNSVTITIGCSPINPSGSCSGPRTVMSDPGCPQSDRHEVCNGEGEDQECWDEWNERCISNGSVTDWACTDALYATMCTAC